MTSKHLSITEAEWRLGIAYENGMGRKKGLPPILLELKKSMERLTPNHCHGTVKDIESSKELREAARRLFREIGPRIWLKHGSDEKFAYLADARDAGRLEWLANQSRGVIQAMQDRLKPLYPRNLCYCHNQEELFDKFVSLLIAKCIRKLENEKRKPKPDDYRLSESLPADEGQIPLSACDCPIPKTGETGCGDQCLNRIMHYECDDNNCRLSVQQCSNRVLADDVVGPEQYLAHRENSSLTFPPTAKTSRSVTATSPSFQAPVATMIGKHGDDEKMVPTSRSGTSSGSEGAIPSLLDAVSRRIPGDGKVPRPPAKSQHTSKRAVATAEERPPTDLHDGMGDVIQVSSGRWKSVNRSPTIPTVPEGRFEKPTTASNPKANVVSPTAAGSKRPLFDTDDETRQLYEALQAKREKKRRLRAAALEAEDERATEQIRKAAELAKKADEARIELHAQLQKLYDNESDDVDEDDEQLVEKRRVFAEAEKREQESTKRLEAFEEWKRNATTN